MSGDGCGFNSLCWSIHFAPKFIELVFPPHFRLLCSLPSERIVVMVLCTHSHMVSTIRRCGYVVGRHRPALNLTVNYSQIAQMSYHFLKVIEGWEGQLKAISHVFWCSKSHTHNRTLAGERNVNYLIDAYSVDFLVLQVSKFPTPALALLLSRRNPLCSGLHGPVVVILLQCLFCLDQRISMKDRCVEYGFNWPTIQIQSAKGRFPR